MQYQEYFSFVFKVFTVVKQGQGNGEKRNERQENQKGIWCNTKIANRFKLFTNFNCWLSSARISLIMKIVRPCLAQGYKAPQ